MIEKGGKYPAYQCRDEKFLTAKAMISLDLEQIIEIANIFFYVNAVLDRLPKWLGGIKFTERIRGIHKTIHDAAVNCAISVEESQRFKQDGGTRD